jgi:hypothetical protein
MADPGVPQVVDRKVGKLEETRGEIRREKLWIHFRWRERPRGQKAQGSKRFRPGLNLRGAKRDTAYRMGASRWNAGSRPVRFVGEASERSDGVETLGWTIG